MLERMRQQRRSGCHPLARKRGSLASTAASVRGDESGVLVFTGASVSGRVFGAALPSAAALRQVMPRQLRHEAFVRATMVDPISAMNSDTSASGNARLSSG